MKNKASYLTLSAVSEGLFKEKGSKFLAFAYSVKSEQEIKEILDGLRKKYFDARHHCYAYMLGKNKDVFRANDDGEPNHSAGDPILGQIRSHSLTNVLIVVIRYFGGTKLGVGGLINAYKTAAAEAIANNQIIETEDSQELNLHFNYPEMNQVMKLVKDHELEISGQKFDNSCEIKLLVPDGILEMVLAKALELEGVKIIES
ncbi:IMPACT family protein [Aquiflexum gelatinilyticum]|uniref:YigZ family protein n=1 Tax=Aquiflexum gelatinilyticum TaxID=2961943 RepID=A0A9X2T326_9BACT|nr:YigZ family protein [Aquiflexum gelatinilyticum]MCR9017271.1 YigZ family protein [Aquiflexum gelatinilyticum]